MSDVPFASSDGSSSAIAALLAAGYDNNAWDGHASGTWPAAIFSSVAAAYGPWEAVGYAKVGSATGNIPAGTFDTQTVSTGDVVARLTWYGDTNLDGAVTGNSTAGTEDWVGINNGWTNHLTGWTNGDLNYDGVVNGSDFTIMDNAWGDALGIAPITIAANADFPVSSLPTVTGLADWQANFGNGDVQTFAPTDTVPNPYPDANASYIAALTALDSGGNVLFIYPHMTVNVTYVTPPAAPTSLSASVASSTEVDLAWTDNASSLAGDIIYESTDDGSDIKGSGPNYDGDIKGSGPNYDARPC